MAMTDTECMQGLSLVACVAHGEGMLECPGLCSGCAACGQAATEWHYGYIGTRVFCVPAALGSTFRLLRVNRSGRPEAEPCGQVFCLMASVDCGSPCGTGAGRSPERSGVRGVEILLNLRDEELLTAVKLRRNGRATCVVARAQS
jgi:hypothetical protein